jgi:trk system potassium uptake protein
MGALLPVANVLGRLLMFFSFAYILPIVASLAYGDGIAGDFAVAMLLNFGVGLLLVFTTRRHHRELKVRDGFLLVTLSWLLMAGMATIPLMIVYTEMSFTNAFFEAMSAMTTTGATVMTGLDYAPQSINLWRHELQWLGGMGIIVLAVAVLPLLGVGGMQLYRAEYPGPMKESRLTARIGDTAKALWIIYVALTLACMASLRLAGMSAFDAICHAFSAVALGGFSTRDASIGAWDSPAIEAVLMAFMVASALNFATHFHAWRARSIRAYFGDTEARAVVSLIVVSCVFIAGYLHLNGVYGDFGTALRHASFNLVSMALDCGFASVDYAQWPVFAPLFMLLLSCITVSSGSTGSGIKMIRTMVLYKQGLRELHRLLHPNIAETIKLGSIPVSNKIAFSVLGFIFLYLTTIVTMVLVMLLSGMDLLTAISAVVSCINNVGPGLGSVGPAGNYAGLTDFQKWALLATMLLGRLEILSVAVIFTGHFWRK